MKNASLVLNIVLLAAVGYLYFLHFSQKPPAETNNHVVSLSNLNIAYVNSDSVLHQYNYYKHKKAELESKQNNMKSELDAEKSKLQHEIEEYQKNAGSMSDMERGRKEEDLSMKQQKLMQKKDELLNMLDEEQNKSNEELYVRLSSFMKGFNKNKNYSFILGYQKGGGIWYASDSLNITGDVLNGLNLEYDKEAKGKK